MAHTHAELPESGGLPRSASRLLACLAILAGTSVGVAQDSVANVAGASDALPAKSGPQQVRFVVDLVPLASSWGNPFSIAPILKASADSDPLFSTQILGSSAASADVLEGVSFAETAFAAWSAAGVGVHPTANNAAGSVSVSAFDKQFGIGFSDISAIDTNAIGAVVGFDESNPSRLFVTRVVGLTSGMPGSPVYSTVSLGAIDASGHLAVRFDNFNTTASQQVRGENLARIDLLARNTTPNTALGSGASNLIVDAAASMIVQNAGDVVTNVPTLIPASLAGSPSVIGFDFASAASAEGAAISGHLASGIAAHRGNPNFSSFDFAGGASVGTVASLARANGSSRTQSINLYRVNASGQPVGTASATLPSGLSDGTHTVNVSGEAEFKQYLSQVGFRGPNGLVATGYNPVASAPLVAATAHDPSGAEFVAVATLGGSPDWQLVAYPGKPILNGQGGAAVGNIIAASPATFSAPAADGLGNVYFVAKQQFVGGGTANALIKAVRIGSGYQLELLLAEGDSFTGANSATPYTISELRLNDSDSIASGAFHAGQLIASPIFGSAGGDAASPYAAGGLIVNATIVYDNAGTPEPYEAVLFVGPGGESVEPTPCPGDINGDGIVNADDLGVLLNNFGCSGAACQADLNNDGIVNADDLGVLLNNFGVSCD